MSQTTISLVTYTYNDANFAADLVRQSRRFTIQPDEIVVVDDGSSTPFRMIDAPANLRVIRLDRNKGITKAKATGLSAASADYILSVDCDTRLSHDWLERALVSARKPEVGMVGGFSEHCSGDDLVSRYISRYISRYGDSHCDYGPVEFIPGNAFLLRRDVWEHSGGFMGYNDSKCQDHYLCARLKRLGYTLFSDGGATSHQLRRMTRTALCRRAWQCCHRPIKRRLVSGIDAGGQETVVSSLFTALAMPMIDRSQDIAEQDESLFYYIELLHLSHAVMDSLDHLILRGKVDEAMRRTFIGALHEFLKEHPHVRTMIHADMQTLGHDLRPFEGIPNIAIWDEFFRFGEVYRSAGALDWLEQYGVAELIREEMEEAFDFPSARSASYAV